MSDTPAPSADAPQPDFVSVVTAEAEKRTAQIDASIKSLRGDRDRINKQIKALHAERLGVARVAAAAAPRKRAPKKPAKPTATAAPAAPSFSEPST